MFILQGDDESMHDVRINDVTTIDVTSDVNHLSSNSAFMAVMQ